MYDGIDCSCRKVIHENGIIMVFIGLYFRVHAVGKKKRFVIKINFDMHEKVISVLEWKGQYRHSVLPGRYL
jgi:hypothetical protein